MNRVFYSYIPFLWYHIGTIYKQILAASNFTYFEKYTFMIISVLEFLAKIPIFICEKFSALLRYN